MPLRRFIILALSGLALSILSIAFLDYQLAPKAQAFGAGQQGLWNAITDMGDSGNMAILLITVWLLAFAIGKVSAENQTWQAVRAKAVIVFAAVLGTGIFAMILKVIVGRWRPYTGEIGFMPFTFGSAHASWPSGHTTSAFAFAVAMGLAFPWLRWPLLALAALTGFSRMVLEKHYLGDVIMGATIGTLGAVLIYNWLRPKLGLNKG